MQARTEMSGASQVVQWVKNLPANADTQADTSSIPGSKRSPGGRNGNPLQYSCLENLMDRRAWWGPFRGGAEESYISKYDYSPWNHKESHTT